MENAIIRSLDFDSSTYRQLFSYFVRRRDLTVTSLEYSFFLQKTKINDGSVDDRTGPNPIENERAFHEKKNQRG